MRKTFTALTLALVFVIPCAAQNCPLPGTTESPPCSGGAAAYVSDRFDAPIDVGVDATVSTDVFGLVIDAARDVLLVW
jgi:hypothetical protein